MRMCFSHNSSLDIEKKDAYVYLLEILHIDPKCSTHQPSNNFSGHYILIAPRVTSRCASRSCAYMYEAHLSLAVTPRARLVSGMYLAHLKAWCMVRRDA